MEPAKTTQLLRRMAGGDAGAANELLPLVYTELHRLAGHYMASERAQHVLQPTALIHEAWIRLQSDDERDWQNRAHFVGVAARAMRQVLIDHARQRKARKRGDGAEPLPIDAALEQFAESGPDLLVLDEALQRLEALDAQLAQIVELRFFAGASNEEIAGALSVSTRTVERGWRTAQAWLKTEIGDESEPTG